MAEPHRVYRSLVLLYPADFRREYGEDLVAYYAEFVADRGARAARIRTSLDLAITIPRYHLGNVMTEKHSATTLSVVIGLLALGGVASLMTDLYPGMGPRRRRLWTAAVLGVVFVASFVAYMALIGDSWTTRETVLSIIGTTAMVGAAGYLVAGLLTPHSPGQHIAASAG